MMEGTVSEKIGHFVSSLSYDELPKEIIDKVKGCLINATAVGASCHNVKNVRMARELIKNEELGIDSGRGATLFCDGSIVTTMGAAFANSVLFHGRAQEDTLGASHLGTVINPTVLALGEREGSTGKRVIEAIVAGYEVAGEIDRFAAAGATSKGFRSSSIFGTFGSAAAASKILGLTEEEVVNAIGFAASFASGLLECWISGSSEWRYEVGVASREGILATLLAREGAVSARTAFEGSTGFLKAFADITGGSEAITEGLGKTWSIMKTIFKPHPICDLNLTPVRGILSLKNENNLSDADVEEITIIVNPEEYDYPGIAYQGPFDAVETTLMSTPYCVSLAFVDSQVTLDGLFRFNDSKIAEMIKMIKHLPGKEIPPYCCSISVKTKKGETFTKDLREGLEYYCFDIDQIVELARQVTSETNVSPDKVERVIEYIKGLEGESDIKELIEVLGSCP